MAHNQQYISEGVFSVSVHVQHIKRHFPMLASTQSNIIKSNLIKINKQSAIYNYIPIEGVTITACIHAQTWGLFH